jgi:hypothetical protein
VRGAGGNPSPYRDHSASTFTAGNGTVITVPNSYDQTAGTFTALGSTGVTVHGNFYGEGGTVCIGSATSVSVLKVPDATSIFSLQNNAVLNVSTDTNNCSQLQAVVVNIGTLGGNTTSLTTTVIHNVGTGNAPILIDASTINGSLNTDSKIGYDHIDTRLSTYWFLDG